MSRKPVLVLGAGINGAAIARELLLNDVPVCLVDAADLAAGATAYSSRLIHGGLRYLEYGEFALVRESLAERARLLTLAPEFVRPLCLFIPIADRTSGWWQAAARFLGFSGGTRPVARGLWLVGLGLWLYDRFAQDELLPRRAVCRSGSGDAPAVHPRYRWLYSYYDAQMTFPERFVVALLNDAQQIAAERGLAFDVFTYHLAKLRGRVAEIGPTDVPNEVVYRFEPTAVLNATGSWVDTVLGQLAAGSDRRFMGGTKGSHFVTFDRRLMEALEGRGLYVEAADGRPFFILPWHRGTLVGTTDVPFSGDPGQALVSEEELAYLLSGVNQVFPHLSLERRDVAMYYAGVRPLPFADKASPAAITRRHWVQAHGGAPPLYSIIGGKLTTCRSLAEEAVAAVMAGNGETPPANSRTRPIVGALGSGNVECAGPAVHRSLAVRLRLETEQVCAVWPLCAGPAERALTDDSGEPLAEPDRVSVIDTELPRGFIRNIVRREWVRRLGDLVERRLMLIYDQQISSATVTELAEILVQEGKLPAAKLADEVEECRQRLRLYYGRELTTTDGCAVNVARVTKGSPDA